MTKIFPKNIPLEKPIRSKQNSPYRDIWSEHSLFKHISSFFVTKTKIERARNYLFYAEMFHLDLSVSQKSKAKEDPNFNAKMPGLTSDFI